MVSDENSAVILCLSVKYLFSLAAFKIFSLLLFSNLIMICLDAAVASRLRDAGSFQRIKVQRSCSYLLSWISL